MFEQTTNEKIIRFKSNSDKDKFVSTLQKRISAYFKENNITPYANAEMWIKAILALSSWAIVYTVIMSDVLSQLTPWAYYTSLIAAFTLLGFCNIFIAFGISHDAAHGTFSKKKWVNSLMGLSFNFVGGNIYLLTKVHTTHHLFANIHGIDPQMESHGFLRNTPHEKYLSKHRFQHVYIFFIYAISYIHWVLIKDFKWMFVEKHIGNEKNIKHPLKEKIILVVFKALYLTLNPVLPLLFLGAPVWVIIVGFLMTHILPGMVFSLIFQSSHVFDGATYPIPDEEGNVENNYAVHTLETTLDFARNNTLATYLMGGINVHVMHHMFPTYCHVHNRTLTKILIQTCEEFGLTYKEVPSFSAAVKRHVKMIKKLSHKDAKVAAYDVSNKRAMREQSV